MSYHYQYLKPLASQKIEKVQKDLERLKQRKSNKFQVEDLREMSYTLPTNYSFTIYRIYISTIDSGELKDVGWVVNDRNTFCLLCFKDFGMSRWKHHCRACGTLVCKDCSNFENELVSFEELGPQKVCQSCYKPSGGAVLRSSRRDGVSLIHPNEDLQANTKSVLSEEEIEEEETYHQTLDIIPSPGFVVKTRREDDSKVFINIYHHEAISDEFLLLLKTIDSSVYLKPAETQMIPTVYLGDKRITTDKNGIQSTLYPVVIASKYFEVVNQSRSTSPALIQKIIEVINLNYHDHLLEQDYVRPRIKAGYQGVAMTKPETFVLNRQPVSMILRISDDETRSIATGTRRSIAEEDLDHDHQHSYEKMESHPSHPGVSKRSYPTSIRPTVLGSIHSVESNPNMMETGSVVSEMTESVNTDASSTLGPNQKRFSSFFYSANNATDGRSLLTSEMLRHTKELSITTKESSKLVEESTKKPQILIGWQIMLFGEEDNVNGVFVVTGTRKNHLRKTEYRVSNLLQEDQWVKLKRNEQKTGIEFRPLRKVLSAVV